MIQLLKIPNKILIANLNDKKWDFDDYSSTAA